MQYCTVCQKQIATIHILDLTNGAIVEQKHLCASCAENTGVVQQKPLKLPPGVLEDLLGGLQQGGPARSRKGAKEGPACPVCGMSAADFKMRGRMGCPRCYQVFKPALLPLLERVHDATSHRGRFPGCTPAPLVTHDILAELRRKLAAAIAAENYEEAAALRDQLKRVEGGAADATGQPSGGSAGREPQ